MFWIHLHIIRDLGWQRESVPNSHPSYKMFLWATPSVHGNECCMLTVNAFWWEYQDAPMAWTLKHGRWKKEGQKHWVVKVRDHIIHFFNNEHAFIHLAFTVSESVSNNVISSQPWCEACMEIILLAPESNVWTYWNTTGRKPILSAHLWLV